LLLTLMGLNDLFGPVKFLLKHHVDYVKEPFSQLGILF